MLEKAFLETGDYRSLLESADRSIVVGRRGSGKSAIVNRLNNYWKNETDTFVGIITPDEDQIIGLRGQFELFGTEYVHIKAAAKIAWRYSLCLELLKNLSRNYKLKKDLERSDIWKDVSDWTDREISFSGKLRKCLKNTTDLKDSPTDRVADLAAKLNLNKIEKTLSELLKKQKLKFILLIDRLDEGFTPDQMGIAIVDGFAQSATELNTKYSEHFRSIVFLRDNIFRAIALQDPDFTRSTEGQVLRLHWDDYGLFNLVCNRLRIAHKSDQENNTKLWNTYAVRTLKGRDGFKNTLRLTLYRPRDILVLLNNAFLNAKNQDRKEITEDDISKSASSISENRLQDLIKEYEAILPSISLIVSSFRGSSSNISVQKAREILSGILEKDDHDLRVQRSLSIFANATELLQSLYGVGFIGIEDNTTNSFVFCHDGREPARDIEGNARLLIHPCYWLALNVQEDDELEHVEEIYDEYDIEISSITDEQRKTRIGKMLEEIKEIAPGKDDAREFEEWCLRAIRLLFAGTLVNIELHPNKDGRQQRDIIATNMCETPVWERVYQDYQSRQIVFEVKNFAEIEQDEFRQINTYLSGEHGKLGFIITRADSNNLRRGKELDWIQELYFNQGKKVVVLLSVKYLMKHLSKLRNPQKHDSADKELNKLIDTYIRNYLIMKAK